MLMKTITIDEMDSPLRQAIRDAVKQHCEDRGIAYPDEWSYTTIHDLRIEFGVTVDLRD